MGDAMTEEHIPLGDPRFPFMIDRKDGHVHATRDIAKGEDIWMSPGDLLWLKYHAKPDPEALTKKDPLVEIDGLWYIRLARENDD